LVRPLEVFLDRAPAHAQLAFDLSNRPEPSSSHLSMANFCFSFSYTRASSWFCRGASFAASTSTCWICLW
jgi:hypothetical protein